MSNQLSQYNEMARTIVPSTDRLMHALSTLAAHPQYSQYQSMQIGPYTAPSKLHSNEVAVGIQECIQLNSVVLTEMEKLGANVDAKKHVQLHPMMPV